MNSTFKIVFNRARGAMTVVNEMTKSHQTGRKAAVAVAVAGALAFSAGVQASEYVEAQGQDKTVTQADVEKGGKRGERQKFCVHGIIGARQSGASNEHEYQTQFS